MKKRAIFISLFLALVLALSLPVTALAAKPVAFSASGTVNYISPGDVFPAGKSGRFVVVERVVTGTLGGDLNGDFTLDYQGNVDLLTQAGNIHGTAEVDGVDLQLNGKSEPIVFLFEYLPGVPVYSLTVTGQWTMVSGAHGNGDFIAVLVFIPTADGHVYSIFPVPPVLGNTLQMTGQWQP